MIRFINESSTRHIDVTHIAHLWILRHHMFKSLVNDLSFNTRQLIKQKKLIEQEDWQ